MIGQRQDLFLQGSARIPGIPALFGFLAQQIGTRDIGNQQRSAEEQHQWFLTAASVAHQQADVFGCVPRGMQGLDLNHSQALTVLQRTCPVTQFGACVREQLQRCTGFDLSNPGQVVVVLVCISGIGNAHALLTGIIVIVIHVPAHIEHQRRSRLLGTDEIGSVPQVRFVELSEYHA